MSVTYKGKTLNRLFRDAQNTALWLKKLHKNCGKKLAKVSKLVTLDRTSLRAPKGEKILKLIYTGDNDNYETFQKEDLKRISRGLETIPDNKDSDKILFEEVSFGRTMMKVEVILPYAG